MERSVPSSTVKSMISIGDFLETEERLLVEEVFGFLDEVEPEDFRPEELEVEDLSDL